MNLADITLLYLKSLQTESDSLNFLRTRQKQSVAFDLIGSSEQTEGMRALCLNLFLSLISIVALSQNKSLGTYQSADDTTLTIKKVFIAPFYDNQNNVYAPTMTTYIKAKVTEENQWVVEPAEGENTKSFKISNQLDSTEAERILIMKKFNVQALMTSKIIKGPKGMSLRMTLYAGSKALPLVQENLDQIQNFETEEIKKNYDLLWSRLKKRMPFNGTLLSRRGSEVTINLGTKNGLTPKAEVRAILILKMIRHPKLQFMTSSEKEILGKIEITKLDDYLSFGTITYEKETNLLAAGMKIQMDEGVFTNIKMSAEGPTDKAAFGDKPKEWLPMSPPQYGLLGVALGLNQYNQSANLTSAAGNLSAVNNFAPTIRLNGEFWLNEEWYFALSLRQSALAVSNGLSNSSPEKLNMSLSQQSVSIGYNLLVTNQFFGPKFQFSAGMTQYRAQIDPSSPVAFTTMNYGGLTLGFAGSFPLSEEVPWDIGAQFKYFLSPTTSESTSSGSVTSTKINDFGVFSRYRRSKNIAYVAELSFEYYATDFDSTTAVRPDPATNISHKITNLLFGIEYLF